MLTRLPGRYVDGETAKSRRVTVTAAESALVLADADGRVLATWPGEAVRLVAATAGEITLRCGDHAPARLVVPAGGEVAAVLRQTCPNLRRGSDRDWRTWRQVGLWTAAAIASVVVLIRVVIPGLAAEIVAAIPAAAEQRLGEAVAGDIIAALAGDATPQVCAGAAGQAALDALAARLAAGLDEPVALRVGVVNSESVNALALPGGQILILRGLIDAAESPDELAGVLAHEIAHVAGRDPLVVTVQTAASSVLAGLVLGDVTGGSLVAGLGTVLVGASYTREIERNADAVGAALLGRAGIGSEGLAAFLSRLDAEYGDLEATIGLFSTHPMSAERLAALPGAAPGLQPAVDAVAWQAIRTICE